MVRRKYDDHECTPEELDARRAEFERRKRIARRFEARLSKSTLGGARQHAEYVWLHCEVPGCGHHAAVPLAPLIIRWGPSAPWARMRLGFRCTRCGGRETSTRLPSWGGEDVGWSPIDQRSQWTGREVWPEPLSMHYLADQAMGWDGSILWHPVLGTFRLDDMCNLYSNTRSRDANRALFRVSDNRAYGFEPMAAIFPKSVAPIVRVAADGEREMVPATWGFPLLREGYAPRPVTNVRDDTVQTSRFWRPSFEARRCLVPASSYCEPDSNTPAGWHWFALANGPSDAHASGASGPGASGARSASAPRHEIHDRPLFAFPGIWKRYRGPLKKDGPEVEVDVYAFMTTAPNGLTATIMHDRMPVLLTEPEEFDTWLSGPPDAAYRLVRTLPAERMRIVQSGIQKRDLLGAEPEGWSLLL